MLNKKLHSPELFTDCDDSIVSLLGKVFLFFSPFQMVFIFINVDFSITEPLSTIVYAIGTTPTISKLQKYALVSVRLMSKIAARNHVTEFSDLLLNLSTIIKAKWAPDTNKLENHLPVELRLYVVQCLGELVENLRVDSTSHVYLFMPAIICVLTDLLDGQIDVGYEITLTAISKIVHTMPLLLSPQLKDLIKSLSMLWSHLQATSSNASHKNSLILDQIWHKMSTSLELRVLMPVVKEIYRSMLKDANFDAIGPMMVLLSQCFQHSEQSHIVQNCNELTTFFIDVMDFRSKFHRKSATVDVQEDFFIKTLVGFILKLSGPLFKAFYHKLLEWSKENAEQSYDRAITFYRYVCCFFVGSFFIGDVNENEKHPCTLPVYPTKLLKR